MAELKKGSKRSARKGTSTTGGKSFPKKRVTKKRKPKESTSTFDAPLRQMNQKVRKLKGTRSWEHAPNKRSLKKYLDTIKAAKDFMNEGHVRWLQGLKPILRKSIYERMRLVDPKGWIEYLTFVQKLGRQKKLIHEESIKEAVAEAQIAIAEKRWEDEGIIKFRHVPVQGFLNIIAMLLAAGHSRLELMEKMELDESILSMVDNQRVRAVARQIPAGIIVAGNSKVLRNIMSDEVDESTARANKIVVDRMKLILDGGMGPEVGEDKSATDELQTAEDQQEAFFGAKPVKMEEPDEEEEHASSADRPASEN